MFPCCLKINGNVPLFPKSDYQNFHVPCSPKLVLFCSLKIFADVPLFPEKKWACSLVPKPWIAPNESPYSLKLKSACAFAQSL